MLNMSTRQKDAVGVWAEIVLRVFFTTKLLIYAPPLLLIQVSKELFDVTIACDWRNRGKSVICSLVKLKFPQFLVIVDFRLPIN